MMRVMSRWSCGLTEQKICSRHICRMSAKSSLVGRSGALLIIVPGVRRQE